MPSCWLYPCATSLALFLITSPISFCLFLNTHLVQIMFLCSGLGTRSHTSFLLNWLSSSCIAKIHPSSVSASSTFVGSIMDSNPKADSSGLKCDLVLQGLSLLPMIWSSGCEDLYLNEFLNWITCWESLWPSSEASTIGTSGVVAASRVSGVVTASEVPFNSEV